MIAATVFQFLDIRISLGRVNLQKGKKRCVKCVEVRDEYVE